MLYDLNIVKKEIPRYLHSELDYILETNNPEKTLEFIKELTLQFKSEIRELHDEISSLEYEL